MSFNPFMEKPVPIEETFLNWNKLYPIPYCKETVDPYTKCRIILMNGTEFEAQWFSRNFSRHCCDNDLRRELAMVRRVEQQQQKRISCLKPKDETILEHTISYEQLAVDAYFERSYKKALQALTLNRTLVDAQKARAVLDDLLDANEKWWPQLV